MYSVRKLTRGGIKHNVNYSKCKTYSISNRKMENINDYLLNYSFKNYRGNDLDDKIQEFIVKFCESYDLLDKRINRLFSMNTWLYNYYDKEDVRQEVIIALLTKSTKKFPYIVGEDRMRYFNTVVSSVLCNLLKDKFLTAGTLVLNKDMEFDDNLIEHSDNSINEIFDLFVGEQLERQLVELYYEGYNNQEIREILHIGRKKFDKIRNNVRNKLREEGIYNEN